MPADTPADRSAAYRADTAAYRADTAAPVATSVRGRLGHIRLNRPRKINALSVEMIRLIDDALRAWASDRSVAAVVIDGAGERGLCAGGDIAAVYDGIRGDAPNPSVFWGDEYAMNLRIAEYPKPVVSVMDGITFGGGIGVGGHASVRLVTETSQLAMPETAIGLSPDVGGLYLFSRMPGELGTHAALTGARIGPGDALVTGLADRFVPRRRVPDVLDALAEVTAGNDVIPVIDSFAAAAPDPEALLAGRSWIDECYADEEAGVIAERLAGHADPDARQAAETLTVMSPTAVSVTLRAIRHAARMSLAEVLEQDLMLSTRFAAHPDFAEGIRAQIIDKDRDPRWTRASLAEVTPADIDAFFAPAAGQPHRTRSSPDQGGSA